MGRVIFVTIILLAFTLLGINNIFGDNRCLIDLDGDGEDEDYTNDQPNHICKKIGSNFCYFPKTDHTLALHFQANRPISGLSNEKFSSKYGGCGIPEYNYEDKKLKIRAKDVRVDEIRNFLNSCGSYNFDIQTDLTYKL